MIENDAASTDLTKTFVLVSGLKAGRLVFLMSGT